MSVIWTHRSQNVLQHLQFLIYNKELHISILCRKSEAQPWKCNFWRILLKRRSLSVITWSTLVSIARQMETWNCNWLHQLQRETQDVVVWKECCSITFVTTPQWLGGGQSMRVYDFGIITFEIHKLLIPSQKETLEILEGHDFLELDRCFNTSEL